MCAAFNYDIFNRPDGFPSLAGAVLGAALIDSTAGRLGGDFTGGWLHSAPKNRTGFLLTGSNSGGEHAAFCGRRRTAENELTHPGFQSRAEVFWERRPSSGRRKRGQRQVEALQVLEPREASLDWPRPRRMLRLSGTQVCVAQSRPQLQHL